MKIKRLINAIKHPSSILHPHTWSEETYLKYLRSHGVKIGHNSRFINPEDTFIDIHRGDYIQIGDNCCLSTVTILAHDYSWYTLLDAFSDVLPDPGGEVKIGNNCFIGFQAVILKDTIIGDNVIIGARSVVKGNIPSNTVWAGCPAKQICTLEYFYNRRKDNRLRDAKKRRDHIINVKQRMPHIEEMGLFSLLFLERTEDNYNKYIKNIELNGVKNADALRGYFYQSKPIYSSFDVFLNE
ncbi:acyltransferase [Macellibacteroides fermentans]|uniref:Transferase hexapeptide (Six repeat-containing protein) n=1 Tax=Parabacteroides chartae TaxID=1037355 RepID=A0A1T5ANM9_9BACT|nr:acyltransferase [Parabacteroides chartae]SKB36465.1 transferase hexapeptide (six repeat-containing protein) [Parabacteroides chartae]